MTAAPAVERSAGSVRRVVPPPPGLVAGIAAGLIASIAVAALVHQRIEPAYDTSASLIVIAPGGRAVVQNLEADVDGGDETGPDAEDADAESSDPVIGQVNPFTRLSGGAYHAAATFEVLTGAVAFGALEDATGLPADYRVVHQPGSPLVQVGVSATTPTDSLDGLSAVITLAQDDLAARQEEVGAPPGRRLRVEVVEQSRSSVPRTAPKVRITALAFLLSLAAVAAIAPLARRALGPSRTSTPGDRSGGVPEPATPTLNWSTDRWTS